MRHFNYPTKSSSVELQKMPFSNFATGNLFPPLWAVPKLETKGNGSPRSTGQTEAGEATAAPHIQVSGHLGGGVSLEGGDLPGGACEPPGSHSRGYPAPGLDRGAADLCTRAPRCRREAAPSVTEVKRKWRRELAHASRGLEEPRPRGPARQHTARSRPQSLSLPESESRCGIVKGEQKAAGSRTGSADAYRGPRGSGPGKPEEGSKDTSLRGTGALVAEATAHH